MRISLCGSILGILLLCNTAFGADYSIQKVEIAPLTSGISFNTVQVTSWVTCPTVEMIGRKEMSILNTSSTNPIFITGVSGSTASRIVYPREEVFFKAGSNLHIYASADTVTLIQVTEIR